MKVLLLFLCLVGSGFIQLFAEEATPADDETGNPFQKDNIDKAIEK